MCFTNVSSYINCFTPLTVNSCRNENKINIQGLVAGLAMSYSGRFQQELLTVPEFKDWVIKHESDFKAYFVVCCKSVDLSNMGKRTLISHAQSKSKKGSEKNRYHQWKDSTRKTKTKVDTEGSTDQPNTSSTNVLCVPNPPEED